MDMMVWDDSLASMATSWAANCDFKAADSRNPEYNGIGQNMFVSPDSQLDMPAAVYTWYREKKHFTFDTTQCAKDQLCRRYTQMVWAKTRKIGCSYNYCQHLKSCRFTRGSLLVCNYSPAGSAAGSKPYVKGAECSKCSTGKGWCKENLCNWQCSKSTEDCRCMAICRNCGTLDPSSCLCQCADGWTGPDCADTCQAGQQCTQANPQPDANKCPPVYGLRQEHEFEDTNQDSSAAGIIVRSTLTMLTGHHAMMMLWIALLALSNALHVLRQ